ncbi:aKG-HExxH-type peptide beta-hydroxylase [Dactylosporangium matsuzakiense]|uniref:HEXXH motif domain-containing protein n=1 Tax=Dactylosporangium matsuzakiense TaxID=53360 RepID=A0A9W6KD93_9ACTN|nr:HEXXH motif-containing putative peptide modification protein [Dactylosporangium matsuzakiense]GLK98623.1 HEXXH motif domain-containing protein [Dactylosporangium matsuzakiense]
MIERYALTAGDLDALGAGYGTVGVHRMLAASQKTRRMLYVRELHDTARDPDLRRAEGFDDALALFARAQAATPAAADAVLHDPFFGVWAGDAMREPAGRLRMFGAYAAAAAVRAGVPFRIAVPAPEGRLTLPGLGAFIGVDGGSAVVEGDPDGHVSLAGGRPAWAPLRRLRCGIAIDDLDPHRDCFEWSPVARLGDAAAAPFAERLEQALELLDGHHPEHAAGIRATLRALVPVTAPDGGNASAASRRAFGAIALEARGGPADLALSLIHECRHMTLGAVLDLVDLFRPGGDPRHYAPWRADPRTVSALLQGTYAHVGVTDFWRVERRRTGSVAAEFEFAYWLEQTSAGARSLLASGELTPWGERFVTRLAETLGRWETQDVRPDVRAAASAAVLAVGVQWRLDNARPDPDGVERLAAAWRGGSPCPALPGAEIRTGPARPARVPAAADRLRQRVLGETAAAPDTADDVWIKLALEAGRGPLVQRPEVVRAVGASTGADPSRLAGWLTSAVARYRS